MHRRPALALPRKPPARTTLPSPHSGAGRWAAAQAAALAIRVWGIGAEAVAGGWALGILTGAILTMAMSTMALLPVTLLTM